MASRNNKRARTRTLGSKNSDEDISEEELIQKFTTDVSTQTDIQGINTKIDLVQSDNEDNYNKRIFSLKHGIGFRIIGKMKLIYFCSLYFLVRSFIIVRILL